MVFVGDTLKLTQAASTQPAGGFSKFVRGGIEDGASGVFVEATGTCHSRHQTSQQGIFVGWEEG